MKKGFTLIELLAVIIILAIVALIATPIVLDVVDDARTSAAKSETAMIVSGINNYCATADMKAQLNNATSECEGVAKEDVSKMVDLGNAKVLELTYDKKVTHLKVESNGKIVEYDGSTYKIDGEVVETVETPEPEEPEKVLYKDNSGANYPDLLDNMIPVKYVDGNVVYADLYQEWYDYDKQMWANAVVLNSGVTKTVGDTISEDDIALMYVWIPRYTYTIFNGEAKASLAAKVIDVKFENGTASNGTVTCTNVINQTDANGNEISEICTDTTYNGVTNGKSTYTHPAFTFDNKALNGFWVGKFEVSGSASQITIKPNVDSLRNQSVSGLFTSILNIDNLYSINGDSHMIKNMEWGAVAYLKQSKYGLGLVDIGINNYYDSTNLVYKTGCGVPPSTGYDANCVPYNDEGKVASTTGNLYGVYDMSGGTPEYVMANMVNSSGTFDNRSAGFTTNPDLKYYDVYTYGTSKVTHIRGKLGDATKETLAAYGNEKGGWHDDGSSFPYSTKPWMTRGGNYGSTINSGVFNFQYANGIGAASASSRAILVKNM